MVKTKIKIDKSKNKKTTKQKQSQKVIINFFKDIVRKKKAKKRKGKSKSKVPPPPQGLTTSSNYQYKDPIPRVPQQIPPPQAQAPQIPQPPLIPQPVGGIPEIPAPIIQPADIQQAVRNALRQERLNQGGRIRPPVRQDIPRADISESDSVSSVRVSGRPPPRQPVAQPRANIDVREQAQRDNAEFVGVGGHQVPQEPMNLINPEQQQQFQRNIQRNMIRREQVQRQREQNMESDSDTDGSHHRRRRDRLQRRQTKELRDVGGQSGIGGGAIVQRDVALGNMEDGQLRRDANEQLAQQQEQQQRIVAKIRGLSYNWENLYKRVYGKPLPAPSNVAENTDIVAQNPSNLSQAYAPSEVQRRTQTGVEDRNQVRNRQAQTKAKTESESESSVSPDDVSKEEAQRIAMRNMIRKTLKKGKENLTEADLEKIAILQGELQALGGSESEYSIPESDIEVKLTHIKKSGSDWEGTPSDEDPVIARIQEGIQNVGKPKKTSKAVARERLRSMGEIISENPARPTKQVNIDELQAIANDMGSSGDEILDYSRIVKESQGHLGKNPHLDRLRQLHTNLKKDDGQVSPDEFPATKPRGVAKGTLRGQYRQNVGMGGEILDPRIREAPKITDTLNRPDDVLVPAPDDLQGQGLPDQQPPQQPSEQSYEDWVISHKRQLALHSDSSSSESEGALRRQYQADQHQSAPTLAQIAFSD